MSTPKQPVVPFFVALALDIAMRAEMLHEEGDERLKPLLDIPELNVPISDAGLLTAFAITVGTSVQELSTVDQLLTKFNGPLTARAMGERFVKFVPNPKTSAGSMEAGHILGRFLIAAMAIGRQEGETAHPPRLVILAIRQIQKDVDTDGGLFAPSAPNRRERLKRLCRTASAAYAA